METGSEVGGGNGCELRPRRTRVKGAEGMAAKGRGVKKRTHAASDVLLIYVVFCAPANFAEGVELATGALRFFASFHASCLVGCPCY